MSFDRNPARGHHVDGDLPRRQLARHGSTPADLRALCRDVCTEWTDALTEHFAGDVDDAPVVSMLHMRKHAASNQVWALYKEVQHLLIERPVILFDRFERLIRRRVDHHNVHVAKCRLDLGDHAIHFCFINHIGTDQHSLVASRAVFVEGSFGRFLRTGVVDGDLCASCSHGKGHCLAKTAGCAGDNRYPSIKSEIGGLHEAFTLSRRESARRPRPPPVSGRALRRNTSESSDRAPSGSGWWHAGS